MKERLTLENYTAEKDHIVRMSQHEQFPDINMTEQAIFGMAAGILMDAIWQRVLKEEFGKQKMDELALKFWEIIGEYSYPLVQMLLKLPPEKDTWVQVKKVIKGIYRAYLVPLDIIQDDADALEFHILACPYESYKGLFDVIENDYVCQNWRDVHTAWLYGLCKRAGLAAEIPLSNMIMDGAICCGQQTCHVIVKRKRQ
ncbi:MAG: hypothetical protein RBT11_12190 [Desulfobacterales bacterium]|jgi:hypothetical protein|nr:hypothetical protein [Desulfobacterales bacterium]